MAVTPPNRAEQVALPLGQSLRQYFGAFLPLEEVSDAVREVIVRAADDGVAGVVGVFEIARLVLARKARVSAEVEALTLVLDAGLSMEEAAQVSELTASAIEAVLLEAGEDETAPLVPEPPARPPAFLLPEDEPAAASGDEDDDELDDDDDDVAALLREVSLLSAGGRPRTAGKRDATAEIPEPEPEPEPEVQVAVEPDIEHRAESEEGEEVPAADEPPHGADPEVDTGQAGVTLVRDAENSSATPRRLPRPREQWADEGEVLRTIPRGVEGPDRLGDLEGPRRFGMFEVVFTIGVIVIAAVLLFVWLQRDGAPQDAADAAPQSSEVLAAPEQVPAAATADAKVALEEVVLTDQVVGGAPNGPIEAFTPGQGAVAWVRYGAMSTPDAMLVAVWFREAAGEGAVAEQLAQSVIALDAAGGVATAELPADAMALPGRYRLDLQIGGQTVQTHSFTVATG